MQSILQPLVPFPIPPAPAAAAARHRHRRARRDRAAPARSRQRPGADGRLPKVDDFILWNEPNHQGLLLPQWEADKTTPASPRVYRAMLRAGYAAVKSVRRSRSVKVLIGNTSSTGGVRGAGPVAPLEFLRELACVDRKLQAAHDGRLRELHDAARRRLGAPPVLAERAPVAHEQGPRSRLDDLRMADLPQLATTLDILVKMGRLAPANRNIHLTEFGYETQPVLGRPTIDELTQARWLTWAEYLADKVPTVRSFAQFLLRDQPPAQGARVGEPRRGRSASTRPGCCSPTARTRSPPRTFLAGLFAQLRSKGRVLIYGRLRLGAGRRTVTAPAPAAPRHVEDDRHAEDRRPLGLHAHDLARAGVASTGSATRRPAGARRSSIAIKPVAPRADAEPRPAKPTLLPFRAACLRLPSSSARAARRPRRSLPLPA